MKQLFQNMKTGETCLEDVPIPIPKPGTALVRTAASLVSAGTERMVVEFAGKSLLGKARSRPDLARRVLEKARREGILTSLEAAFNRLDQPLPLGYSSAGTIVQVGEALPDLRVHQRVACGGGGYAVHAEYVVVPKNLLVPLPDSVDFESAAFATLGSVAMHGFRLAAPQIGEGVVVIGLGLLGLLTVGIARAAGCRVLGVDLNPDRVALGRKLGAEAVPRDQAEEAAQVFTRGRGADAILICADTPSDDPVTLAGAIARDRARVIALGAVGQNIPRKVYYAKELTFLNSRSYGPGRYDPAYEERGQDYPIGFVRWTEGRNMEAFVDLLTSGRLDVRPLITHRIPIHEAPQAYELITGRRQEPFLGVLLTYPDAGSVELGSSRRTVVVSGGQSPVSSKEVSLGVIGAGNFATAVLLPAIKKLPGLALVGIASPSGSSARHAAKKFGFRYAASDAGQILADPAINTIAILTRHHLHASLIVKGLAGGKHVFCEKPPALDVAQLSGIVEQLTAPGAQPLLMVGYNRRFAPLSRQLASFLADRREPLVANYRVNAGFLPPDHWLQDPEEGGGRLIGEGCHFVDYLTFLVGESPVSVSAQSMPDGGRYREDNFILTFTFPDGSLGTVTYLANGDKAFPKERVEVFCGGRVAVLDDFRTLELVRDGRRRVIRTRLRQDKGHQSEWEAFLQAILTDGPPPIPYAHLFGGMQATFAAQQALRQGEPAMISP